MENRVQLFVIVFVRQHITKEVTIVILHISITLDSYECSRACTFFSGNDNVCFLYPTFGEAFQQGLIPHHKFYNRQCSC